MATNTNPFYTYSATAGSSKTLQKPQDGGDNNQWGNYINTDLDEIVAAVNALSDKIADASENTLVDFTATGSAVNHVGITNAAAGNGPTISAAGSESDVDLNVTAKGNGDINLTQNKLIVNTGSVQNAVNFDSNTLSIDALNARIGVNDVAPTYQVDIQDTGSLGTQLRVETTANAPAGIRLESGDSGSSQIYFGDQSDNDIGRVVYNHSDDAFFIEVNTSEALRIKSDGNTGIGTNNPFADLSIVDNSSSNGVEIQPEVASGVNRISNYNRSSSSYVKLRLDASEYQIYISGSEAININSSGSITTPSGEFNGTIGTSATATANLPAVKTAINASGSTPIYASRAWAYFDGSGTVSLINSQNISSLADRGTGLYTINFTTDMPTADFCGVAGAIPGSDPANRNRMANVQPTSSSSTSDAYVNAFDTSGNATDVDQVTVIIMA